jgi:hypothetical protein
VLLHDRRFGGFAQGFSSSIPGHRRLQHVALEELVNSVRLRFANCAAWVTLPPVIFAE